MAFPFIAAAVALTALGGAMTIKKGYDQQQIAETNAATEEVNAQYAKIAAGEQAFRIRYTKRLTMGAMATGYARGGVKVGVGSSGDVLAETANQYDLDALKMEIQGRVAESAYYRSAHLMRKQGQMAVTHGFVSAFSQMGVTGLQMAGAGWFNPTSTPPLETTGFGSEGYVPVNLPGSFTSPMRYR